MTEPSVYAGLESDHCALCSQVLRPRIVRTDLYVVAHVLQGFLSRTEGVIFKWVRKGSPAAAPWQILKQEGENLRQVPHVSLL